MKEQVLANRYSKALVGLGQENNLLSKFHQDLLTFNLSLQKTAGLARLLNMREVDRNKRSAIIRSVAQHLSLQPSIQNFLLLLVERNRFFLFPFILKAFETEVRSLQNEVVVEVRMADPVTTQKKIDALRCALEKMIGKKVLCKLEEDPRLIGGIQVRIGDTVYDGSIRNELEKIQEALL